MDTNSTPSLKEQARNSVIKSLPNLAAGFISTALHALFIIARELSRVISEALNR